MPLPYYGRARRFDASWRFSCKPEQVQAVREHVDTAPQLSQHPWLSYSVGDIITVLDKRPATEDGSLVTWKGVLSNSKTGFFNPSHTVAYLGPNVPSNKLPLVRGDGKNTCSSRRRLRPDMISRPQGDLKHTGHVGLDGTFFGDVGILASGKADVRKLEGVPVHRVVPYKPYDSADAASALSRAGSDASERAPLLKKQESEDSDAAYSVGGASWSPVTEVSVGRRASHTDSLSRLLDLHSAASLSQYPLESIDHYTEISDDEEEKHSGLVCSTATSESNRNGGACSLVHRKENATCGSTFDLGPSLMDEVLRALDDCSTGAPAAPDNVSRSIDVDVSNVRNEIRELTLTRPAKKKQMTVKPISASDERTLDSAIALAHEMASRSMLALNQASDGDVAAWSVTPPLQSPPSSPTSPSSHHANRCSKFSFK
ncbi:CRIB domain [Trinorchestia longiramus]|nr:CRIB domain [Trinorchestia longiramus]